MGLTDIKEQPHKTETFSVATTYFLQKVFVWTESSEVKHIW